MTITSVLEPGIGRENEDMTTHYEYTQVVVQSLSFQYIGPVDQDDIVQDAFIRFWLISKKQLIASPRAYIRRIVSSVIIDAARRYKPHLYQGLVDEYGEMQEASLLDTDNIEANPEVIIQEKEAYDELMRGLVSAVAELSPRQQHAAVCVLRERVDDLEQFVDDLEAEGVDSQWQWPLDKTERQRLRASFVHARRNIAQHMDIALAS